MPDSISRHTLVPCHWGHMIEAFSFNPHLNPRKQSSSHPPEEEQLHRWANRSSQIRQLIGAEPGWLLGLSDSRHGNLPRDCGRQPRPVCPASLPIIPQPDPPTGSDLPMNCIKACSDASPSQVPRALQATELRDRLARAEAQGSCPKGSQSQNHRFHMLVTWLRLPNTH